MGSFASTMFIGNIPEEKYLDFEKNEITLIKQSGMMAQCYKRIYGDDDICMLAEPKLEHGDYVDVSYNYFESDSWENAGYSRRYMNFYSNKKGGQQFSLAVLAGHILEGLYTDGFSVVFHDGVPVVEATFLGWINYILKKDFEPKIMSPWQLYEWYHYEHGDEEYMIDQVYWDGFLKAQRVDVAQGYIAVKAIRYNKNVEMFYDSVEGEDKFNNLRGLRKAIQNFRTKSQLVENEQVDFLLQIVDDISNAMRDSKPCLTHDQPIELQSLIVLLLYVNNLVVYVKLIAEIYDTQFWTLWDKFRGRNILLLDKAMREKPQIDLVDTAHFFATTNDELLLLGLYTEEKSFSPEMLEWFDELKNTFTEKLSQNVQVKNPIKRICTMLKFAFKEYYKVYAFESFWEETLENLLDKRYWILWLMFEEMLHDPKMLRIVDEIFIPREKQKERYSYDSPRVLECIISMEPAQKNFARKRMRDYMALVNNKEVRKMVFGF